MGIVWVQMQCTGAPASSAGVARTRGINIFTVVVALLKRALTSCFGEESYDQLPNTQGTLRCTVRNARTVAPTAAINRSQFYSSVGSSPSSGVDQDLAKVLDVPSTYVNESRYSFRLNVTVADQQEPGVQDQAG